MVTSRALDGAHNITSNMMQVIGAALNSVTSLFNNSCDVNTVKFHQGRKTVMLARSGHIVINLSDSRHIG